MVEVVKELFPDEEIRIVPKEEHLGGSSDVGDVQHLQPVITFHTGGISGGLHQVDFAIVDEERAYLDTAKIFALSAYRLLRNQAQTARRLVDSYEPRFKSREEYVAFMDRFSCVVEK
jgi:hypothetical protein